MPYAPIAVTKPICGLIFRSHLKNRILFQDQGGSEVQPAGILKYSEELKRRPNTEIGLKDFFEIAYSHKPSVVRIRGVIFPVNTYHPFMSAFF